MKTHVEIIVSGEFDLENVDEDSFFFSLSKDLAGLGLNMDDCITSAAPPARPTVLVP